MYDLFYVIVLMITIFLGVHDVILSRIVFLPQLFRGAFDTRRDLARAVQLLAQGSVFLPIPNTLFITHMLYPSDL